MIGAGYCKIPAPKVEGLERNCCIYRRFIPVLCVHGFCGRYVVFRFKTLFRARDGDGSRKDSVRGRSGQSLLKGAREEF